MVSHTHTQATPAQNTSENEFRSSPLTEFQFVWGAGLECSFIPHLDVDQFQWTQHNRFWKEDFRLAREETGISNVRYSLPWHLIELQPGHFDWKTADERIELAESLGINLILDVMHFGTPLWLKQAVGDPEFPEALERYSEALVSRYRHSVKIWSPCNEPLVCALFSGDFGFWPPHARKWRGYMPILSRVVQGVSRGIRAIRRAMPEATVLLCDAAEHFKTRHEELNAEVMRRNLRRFAVMDLLTGRVDRNHPLQAWMLGYGMTELDLEWFRSHPQSPDILGLDYYPHSDWQIEISNGSVRQRRADSPAGLHAVASEYYERYGIPLMLTETSIEGTSMNREMWFDLTVEHIARLREHGIPMLGCFWWPLLDQIDWDGALTHRIGKIHQVGLFKLSRRKDGTLQRSPTPMVEIYRDAAALGDERIGKLEHVLVPTPQEDQGPPCGDLFADWLSENYASAVVPASAPARTVLRRTQTDERQIGVGNGNGHGKRNGNGNGHAATSSLRGSQSSILSPETETEVLSPEAPVAADPAPGLAGEPVTGKTEADATDSVETDTALATGRYGIVVFSHLRWGFVWQRPQQFLSRFARVHQVLFMEEPQFDLVEGSQPHLKMHRVMPNVTVACPHVPNSYNRNPALPELLRKFTRQAMADANTDGAFDCPLLWYYSPMDAAWSLGHFENRGIIYDCMDELSQFTGAPKALISNEARLMEHADVIFTGGYELWLRKKQRENVHFFGCGVEFNHFAQAQDEYTTIPPDIDFMARPILGWFGVIDERVDYGMVGEMARLRPEWSFAMVGPVVKVDPNLLPHSPNLYWLGQRDYTVLPNYCRAFDICMMPFSINAATQYINPTKTLEYFATGRPVISTPVTDVVRQFSDLVEIVKTTDEFLAAAERLLQQPDQERIARGIEKARASSWESTVKAMREIIGKAIADPGRRSSRKPEALKDDVLTYQYMATPGS
jgi:beta-glucosidase/6-phospho-beta-glucosidase/beta-galactosidase/glycosyltransferase involved in cell wall biosynthesis